ncbi:MAG: hypothetical protein AAGI90_03890 [Chlamydiota bacterium]
MKIFSEIWNGHDLIVSMDGMSFMCPPEIREGYSDPWMHVDQTIMRRQDGASHSNQPPAGFISESVLKTEPYTIQGQFLFADSCEGDGGFYCFPKSHHRFAEFAPELERISEIEDSLERRREREAFLEQFFANTQDDFGNPYLVKHVQAPKGSLILWDSRTIHWNEHASKDRASETVPKVRMVGYLCYVPKTRLTQEGKMVGKEAFEKGVSTGHNPAVPECKYTQDHIWPEFQDYLEDPLYIQPKIKLTALGDSLLGFDRSPITTTEMRSATVEGCYVRLEPCSE